MKLGLGTVQLGMDYGVTNPGGQVPFAEAMRILALAAESGIRVLDTAPAYGSSEEVLGRILPQGHKFQIVTKTPHLLKELSMHDSISRLVDTFELSLKRLRQKNVYGLLVHGPEDLFRPVGKNIFSEMRRLQKTGQVEKIGASIYDARQIDSLLDAFDIDLIQLPLNVLDQRLIESGHLRKLKEKGVEIHVRSVFLQGILLTPPDSLPDYFIRVKGTLRRYHDKIASYRMTPVQAALAFAGNVEEVDVVLCGVTSCMQLSQALKKVPASVSNDVFSEFAIQDISVLNPSRWEVA